MRSNWWTVFIWLSLQTGEQPSDSPENVCVVLNHSSRDQAKYFLSNKLTKYFLLSTKTCHAFVTRGRFWPHFRGRLKTGNSNIDSHYQLFEENKFNLKARYKPVYNAILQKMGPELIETVEEIVNTTDTIEKGYA